MKKIFNYVLAISAIVIGMAFGSCNEEEFPSPSHPDGDVAVSYTHLTLPTKA